jgi:hypothetical protein
MKSQFLCIIVVVPDFQKVLFGETPIVIGCKRKSVWNRGAGSEVQSGASAPRWGFDVQSIIKSKNLKKYGNRFRTVPEVLW